MDHTIQNISILLGAVFLDDFSAMKNSHPPARGFDWHLYSVIMPKCGTHKYIIADSYAVNETDIIELRWLIDHGPVSVSFETPRLPLGTLVNYVHRYTDASTMTLATRKGTRLARLFNKPKSLPYKMAVSLFALDYLINLARGDVEEAYSAIIAGRCVRFRNYVSSQLRSLELKGMLIAHDQRGDGKAISYYSKRLSS